jgi:hypothetical protein
MVIWGHRSGFEGGSGLHEGVFSMHLFLIYFLCKW